MPLTPFPDFALYLLSAAAAAHGPAPLTWEWLLQTNLINQLIAYAVVILIIRKLALGAKIQARRKQVEQELKALETERDAARADLDTLRQRTANLEGEVAGILQGARESADSLSAAIIADAGQQAERIIEAAKRRIELEQRTAAKDLEARLMRDALADAREALAQRMGPEEQRRSVESFLEELSSLKSPAN